MSDDQRLEAFASSAGNHITGPGLEALARTATRRRRGAIVASTCAALAISAVVGVGLQSLASDRSTPAHPSPTSPTTAPSPTAPIDAESRRAKRIVENPKAGDYRLIASPEDPDVKASAWAYCLTLVCKRHVAAVAVTSDGFATASYVRVRWLTDITWVSGDSFIVRGLSGQLELVSASQPTRPIAPSGPSAPLSSGDLLVGDYADGPTPPYVAVDPKTLTSHPVPVPYEGDFVHVFQHDATTLWGRVGTSTIVTSPDGGATWRTPYASPGGIPLDIVQTPVDGPMTAIQRAGFGKPPALLRSDDDGASWQVIHPTELLDCTIQWTAVTPAGDLLAYAYPGPMRTCDLTAGVQESRSDAWTTFHRVPVSGPVGFDGAGSLASTTVDARGHQRLYLYWSRGLLVSDDEGRTWRLTADR